MDRLYYDHLHIISFLVCKLHEVDLIFQINCCFFFDKPLSNSLLILLKAGTPGAEWNLNSNPVCEFPIFDSDPNLFFTACPV